MSVFILVHGAWHGAWCWRKLVPLLEREGHRVIAPDLPGLGEDRTPLSLVTLETWTRHICRILDEQDLPSVLVGHSRGGIVISQAAEYRPRRVKALVYLSAFLLQDGQRLMDIETTGSLLLPLIVPGGDGISVTLKEEGIREALYADCAEEDVARAKRLIRDEPSALLETPLALTEECYGSVPRVYIECLKDRAIPLAAQRRMQGLVPCRTVITMNTGHSPFFSAAGELAAHLMSLEG